MPEPIKFGVLGCGRIVHRGFLPGIAASPQATLHAVASLRPGVAPQVAEEHGVPRVYDSYEAVLADAEVQAVYVPCAGDLHHKWTIAAAEAGKHVLCEKPLAPSVAEAEEMVAACREAGVILQEAFMWRHHARAKRAKRLIEAGGIGEVRLICAHFSFDVDRDDWRLDPARGGGAMWDIGCYGVNASRHFTGAEPTEIHARANFDKPRPGSGTQRGSDTGVDMTMQIALTFPAGVLANIDCSFEAPFRCHVEVVGTGGMLILPRAFLPVGEAELIHHRDTDRETEPETITFPESNQHADQLTDFCASIAAGSLQPPAEDGLANMRVLQRALQTAKGR
jgi:xylose dehydrogenase (NAD/NADP)